MRRVPNVPRLEKGTYRSKVGKDYLKAQCWQRVPTGPRLSRVTNGPRLVVPKGPMLEKGFLGPRLVKDTYMSKDGKGYLKVQCLLNVSIGHMMAKGT